MPAGAASQAGASPKRARVDLAAEEPTAFVDEAVGDEKMKAKYQTSKVDACVDGGMVDLEAH